MRAVLLHAARPSPRRARRSLVSAPDEGRGPGQADAQPVGRSQAATGVLRILVVDDDPLMTDLLPRKLGRSILSPRTQILTARTPEEGIRLAVEERPDVVISDFNLRASRDGLDVLDAVRRLHPDAIRILFSAHTRVEIGTRIDRAEIHGFIEKTMRLDEMMGPLFDLIEQRTGRVIERAGSRG